MPTALPDKWSDRRKTLFRLVFCFFVVYIFPFPLNAFPFLPQLTSFFPKPVGWYNAIFSGYDSLMHLVIPWLAAHVYRVPYPITIFSNGSGDTSYDYLLVLTLFIISLIAGATWSVLDKKRDNYEKLHYWLIVFLRYFVASNMYLYGMEKVFHLQMSFPNNYQLVQQFGDKSPMALAWNFVGYSTGYSEFTGWSEVIAGTLLMFRRTTALGAILAGVIMTNVAAMNLFYDIPVKLFAIFLVITSIAILWPDLRRLINVMILNKAVPEKTNPQYLVGRREKMAGTIIKWLIVSSIVITNILENREYKKTMGEDRVKPPLYGIYNAELLVRNKDTVPFVLYDTTQWKQLVVDYSNYASIKAMDDTLRTIPFEVDTATRAVVVYSYADTLHKSKLHYLADSGHLMLYGKLKDDSVYMKFRKVDINSFRLVSRGFHWINEHPYHK